jgi:hypothetical protein
MSQELTSAEFIEQQYEEIKNFVLKGGLVDIFFSDEEIAKGITERLNNDGIRATYRYNYVIDLWVINTGVENG